MVAKLMLLAKIHLLRGLRQCTTTDLAALKTEYAAPSHHYKTLSGATSKAKRVWEAKQFSNCACHMGRGRRHAPACTFKQFRDYLFVPTPVT